MVWACSICGQTSDNPQSSTISYHNIPKNEGRRQNWLKSIGKKIKNFNPSSAAKICSRHFTNDSFFMSISGKRFLKLNAIPTIFDTTRAILEIIPHSEDSSNIDDSADQNEIDADPIATTVSPKTAPIILETITSQCDMSNEMYDLNTACETLSTENSETVVPQIETPHVSIGKRLYKTKYGMKGTNLIWINDENDSQSKLQKQLQEASAYNGILQQKLRISQRKNRRYEKRIKKLLKLLEHFYARKIYCQKQGVK